MPASSPILPPEIPSALERFARARAGQKEARQNLRALEVSAFGALAARDAQGFKRAMELGMPLGEKPIGGAESSSGWGASALRHGGLGGLEALLIAAPTRVDLLPDFPRACEALLGASAKTRSGMGAQELASFARSLGADALGWIDAFAIIRPKASAKEKELFPLRSEPTPESEIPAFPHLLAEAFLLALRQEPKLREQLRSERLLTDEKGASFLSLAINRLIASSREEPRSLGFELLFEALAARDADKAIMSDQNAQAAFSQISAQARAGALTQAAQPQGSLPDERLWHALRKLRSGSREPQAIAHELCAKRMDGIMSRIHQERVRLAAHDPRMPSAPVGATRQRAAYIDPRPTVEQGLVGIKEFCQRVEQSLPVGSLASMQSALVTLICHDTLSFGKPYKPMIEWIRDLSAVPASSELYKNSLLALALDPAWDPMRAIEADIPSPLPSAWSAKHCARLCAEALGRHPLFSHAKNSFQEAPAGASAFDWDRLTQALLEHLPDVSATLPVPLGRHANLVKTFMHSQRAQQSTGAVPAALQENITKAMAGLSKEFPDEAFTATLAQSVSQGILPEGIGEGGRQDVSVDRFGALLCFLPLQPVYETLRQRDPLRAANGLRLALPLIDQSARWPHLALEARAIESAIGQAGLNAPAPKALRI